MLHTPSYYHTHKTVELLGVCNGCVPGVNILQAMAMKKLG